MFADAYGWTADQVGQMTVPQILEYYQRLAQHSKGESSVAPYRASSLADARRYLRQQRQRDRA